MWAAGTLITIAIISIIRINSILFPFTSTFISGFCDPMTASSVMSSNYIFSQIICFSHNTQSDDDCLFFSHPHQKSSVAPGPPPCSTSPCMTWLLPTSHHPFQLSLLSCRCSEMPTCHTCSCLKIFALADLSIWSILFLGLPWLTLILGTLCQCPENCLWCSSWQMFLLYNTLFYSLSTISEYN